MAGILNAELAFPQFPALDQYGPNTTLLLHGDGTNGQNNNQFIDSSSNIFTITRNGNTTQGTFSPFSQPNGYWSNYFNGSAYLSIASNAALNMNTYGCVECWVYLSSTGSNQLLFGRDSNWWLAYDYTGIGGASSKFVFTIYNGSSWQAVSSSTTLVANQWYHIAGIKDNATLRIYINGNQQNTASFSGTPNTAANVAGIGANPLGGGNITGYVSNARLITGASSGVLPYTGNFTPPTAPLTAVTGTQLLTCQSNNFVDKSSNTLAITPSSASVQAFHPISAPTAYYPAVNGGGAYFDGSGDQLNVSPTAINSVGSSDFSFECWVYATRQTNTYAQGLISYGPAGVTSTTSCISFQLTNAGYLASTYAAGDSILLTDSNLLVINQWNHCVVCRSGSTISLFKNGARVATSSTSATVGSGGDTLTIGGQWYANDANRQLQGYMSGVRIVKGSSAYDATQSTITVPTTPLTAITNTSLLLSFTNAGIIDSVSQNQLETVGNAQVSTTQSKFGGASMSFNGSTDYLKLPTNPALGMGSGDFTIEAWIYPTTVSPTYQGIFSTTGTSSSDIQVQLNTNLLRFTSYTAQIAITTSTISANVWTHIAVCRSGGTTYLYINGNLGGSGADSTNWVTNPANIGAIFNSSYPFSGYIDDLRITKGIARYTQNFTPPQNAYPDYGPLTNIPTVDPNFKNTTLLLHGNGTNGAQNNTFLDSSTNNFTITRNGNTTQGTFTPFSQPNGWWSNYFGGSQSINAPASTSFQFAGDFTIEAWAYPTTTGDKSVIVQNSGSNYLALNINPGTGFNIYLNSSGPSISPTDIIPQVNQWNHVALVRSGSTVKVYLNGVASGTTATNSSTVGYNAAFYIGALGTASSGSFSGYISNIRVVNGTSVYTSNFTPSTLPFTAITNTSLLTCQSNYFKDNSTNAFAITANGTPTIQNFYPFFPPLDYSPAAIGGSAYFDGSGDYLSSSVGAIGTGDFTVEFYANRDTSYATYGGYFQISTTSGGLSTNYANGLLAYSNSGTFFFFIGTSPYATSYTITTNEWVHFAIVRSSGTVKVYVNGVLSSTPVTDTTNISGTYLALAGYYDSSYLMKGYLSNFRLLIGTALYTSNFTPPTAPLTAITNTSFLLSATNGGIFDNASKNMFETVGTAQISTTQSKFGGSSIYLNGSGNYLLSSSAQAYDKFGTADFTVEYWIYLNSSANQQAAVVCGAGTVGYDPIFGWVDSSALQLYLSSAASGWDIANAVTIIPATISTGQWYHVAVTRNGSTFKTFCNGNQVSTFTSSASIYQSAGQINIGRYASGYPINAYFDDIRITNGFARYRYNFTPPAAQFPNK